MEEGRRDEMMRDGRQDIIFLFFLSL